MFSSNPHKKSLSIQDVHTIRHGYFIKLENLNTLAGKYNISITTLKKAIHAKPPYHTIQDQIHESIKKNRKPARLSPLGSRKHMQAQLVNNEMEKKRELIQRSQKQWKDWEEFNK